MAWLATYCPFSLSSAMTLQVGISLTTFILTRPKNKANRWRGTSAYSQHTSGSRQRLHTRICIFSLSRIFFLVCQTHLVRSKDHSNKYGPVYQLVIAKIILHYKLPKTQLLKQVTCSLKATWIGWAGSASLSRYVGQLGGSDLSACFSFSLDQSFFKSLFFLFRKMKLLETQEGCTETDSISYGSCSELAHCHLCVHTTGKSHGQSQCQRDKNYIPPTRSLQPSSGKRVTWTSGDNNSVGHSPRLPLKTTSRQGQGRNVSETSAVHADLSQSLSFSGPRLSLSLTINMSSRLGRGSHSLDTNQRGDLRNKRTHQRYICSLVHLLVLKGLRDLHLLKLLIGKWSGSGVHGFLA